MRYLLLCLLLTCYGVGKGQLWQPIGGSASGPVRCLYADTAAGLLYVGGDFGTIGGLPAYQVATWDGANWDTLGPGTGDLGCAAGCFDALVVCIADTGTGWLGCGTPWPVPAAQLEPGAGTAPGAGTRCSGTG